jgi:hypothetical protein
MGKGFEEFKEFRSLGAKGRVGEWANGRKGSKREALLAAKRRLKIASRAKPLAPSPKYAEHRRLRLKIWSGRAHALGPPQPMLRKPMSYGAALSALGALFIIHP